MQRRLNSRPLFIDLLVVLLVITLFDNTSTADKNYVYQVWPSNSELDFRCILGNIEFARAIKYQNDSSTCDKLSTSWNTNRIFEAGFVYIWIDWFETTFTEATIKILPLPENFGIGCRIDVVVETTDVIGNGFYVNIDSADYTVRYIHLSVRPTLRQAILNTKVNGTWLEEVQIPIDGFVNSTNTVYTSTFYLLSTHWEVYTDDVFLGNFTHINAFNGTGKIRAESDDVLCKRIIFYGP